MCSCNDNIASFCESSRDFNWLVFKYRGLICRGNIYIIISRNISIPIDNVNDTLKLRKLKTQIRKTHLTKFKHMHGK